MSEPVAEVEAASPGQAHLCSAIAQYLSFLLVAMGEPGEKITQRVDARHRAMADLHQWREDFETILQTMSVEGRRPPPSSPAYELTSYHGVDRTPTLRRRSKRLRMSPPSSHSGDKTRRVSRRRDQSSSSDDDGDIGGLPRRRAYTPSPMEPRTRTGRGGGGGGRGSRPARDSQRSEGAGAAQRARRGGKTRENCEATIERETNKTDKVVKRVSVYCTHSCLGGLVQGGSLDPKCPNFRLHLRAGSRSSVAYLDDKGNHADKLKYKDQEPPRHPIPYVDFLPLLQKQMATTLDKGIVPLGLGGGARRVLFKVTLLAYGYRFIGKGTIKTYMKHLEHEAAMYRRMETLQGRYVPVFLGSIDLRSIDRVHYYWHRVYIVHLSFLSWAGTDLFHAARKMNDATKALAQHSAAQAVEAISRLGIVHCDIRPENLVTDPASNYQTVMVVDFERATLAEQEQPRRPLRPALRQLTPGSRQPGQGQYFRLSRQAMLAAGGGKGEKRRGEEGYFKKDKGDLAVKRQRHGSL